MSTRITDTVRSYQRARKERLKKLKAFRAAEEALKIAQTYESFLLSKVANMSLPDAPCSDGK